LKISKIRSALLRNLWLILIITILGTSLTWTVSKYFVKPVYEAKTTLYIYSKPISSSQITESSSYDQLLANSAMIKDYIELITSNRVLQGAINNLSIKDMTAVDLGKNVQVENDNASDMLSIFVDDNSPQLAKALAYEISEQFISTVSSLTGQNNINIVDAPVQPVDPIIPKTKSYVIIAFAGLFLASCAMVIMKEYLDGTIRTVDDIEEGLDLNVIGIIPEMGIK